MNRQHNFSNFGYSTKFVCLSSRARLLA